MPKWQINSTPFEINPVSYGLERRKRITVSEIIEGEDIIQEGEREVDEMSCEITVLTSTAFSQLNTWYEASGLVTLTDDNNISYSALITGLSLKRTYATNTQYYFTGTISFKILSGL